MKFGLIYDSADSHITSRYLRQALPETGNTHFDLKTLRSNFDIEQFVGATAERQTAPDVLLCEIGAPGLPHGLDRVSRPTVILDIDTFGWTPYRLKWSMLFDYVFTWHPSYVSLFQEAGHPRVFALPHAVDDRIFGDFIVDTERPYDIGFVGNRGLTQYRRREQVISTLAARFRTNDLNRHYSTQEMADVYGRSKISVNVSRSEFPQEANMRCYEVMAAGALLMTGIPTELTEWGFREGEHFVGWRTAEEIPELVEQFLRRKEERLTIARAGQERTLKDFTYQRCAETLVETLERDNRQLFAPAREWSAEDVHLLYLSYYYRFGIPWAALEEFQRLRRAYPRAYWAGLPMVLKTLRRVIGGTLM